MEVRATVQAPLQTGADTICVGLLEGEAIPHDLEGDPLGALVASGEARPALRRVAHTHAQGCRFVLVGLGRRDELNAERARVAAAVALGRARELAARTLCWELPHAVDDAVTGGLVEGTVLAAYRFDRYRSQPPKDPQGPDELIVSAHHDVSSAVRGAAALSSAQNAARDLQNQPGNELTPTALAEYARARAQGLEGVAVEIGGRDDLLTLGMGAFASVAQGSAQEPRLIVLRYEAPGARGPLVGLVGKAVTFDSGGISIKPGAKMMDMKYDMSGGAAVIEAVLAAARLGLPVRVLGVVGAVENMPSGSALKPGDIVRASTGTTIEIVNTDAEGRLVLADCLAHAVSRGAQRLVDVATLTGAIVVTLGSTYAGVMGNNDAWCAQVAAAGARSGEPLWRLPLDPEYAELVKGVHADLRNAVEERKASSITAAELLRRFVGDVPWAHLDIAGVAWDTGRAYAAKGGSGFGVRLLVELLRDVARL